MAATIMQKRINNQLRCKRDLGMIVMYHREELKKVLKALMKENIAEVKEGEVEDMLPVYVFGLHDGGFKY